jgi:hypothetical protein
VSARDRLADGQDGVQAVEAALPDFAPDILEQLALPCVGPVWSAEIPSGDLSCRIKHLKRWPLTC